MKRNAMRLAGLVVVGSLIGLGCSGSTSNPERGDGGTSPLHDGAADSGHHDAATDSKAGHDAAADSKTEHDSATEHDAASDTSSLSPEKACGDEAAALCALRDMCAPGYDILLNYGTEAICESRTAQTCINSLDAAGQGSTATHVEGCATAYPGESCVAFFDDNPVAACVAPAGTVATGAACGVDGQCVSTFCATGPYAICGTCQPLPVAGATCQVEADCGRDLACAIPAGATTGKCSARAASGAACLTGYDPCDAGLDCVGDDEATMTMGTCQAAGSTVGTACQTTRKTVAGCDAALGLVCVPTTGTSADGTCQAITFAGAGSPCGIIGTPETGFVACKGNGLCEKAAPTDTAGTCVAPAADGAACDNDPSIGPPCLTPAKCVVASGSSGTAGTCTVPNAATCM